MRKMNFKKSAAVILSTVCMVTALVGCGSSSADNGADADFMVGTADLSIVGTTHDGREIPVFINGNFAI